MSTGAQNIVSLGFNIEEIKAQKKEVEGLFVDLFGKLEQYDGTRFNPLGGGGLGDLRKSINDGAKAMGEIQALAAKYNETITEQARRLRDLAKAYDEVATSQKKGGNGRSGTGGSPAGSPSAQGTGSAPPPSSGPAPSEKPGSTFIFAQTTSFEQLNRMAVENQRALKDNATAQRDLEKNYKSGTISLDDYLSKMESLRAEQTRLKIANADVVKSLSLMEKQTQAAAGSQLELETKLDQLKIKYSKLSEVERNAPGGESLLKELQELDAEVKNINYSVGQFQRNVGNYSGSFVKALEAIGSPLAKVKNEMSGLEEKGKAVVNDLTGRNPVGFDPNRHKGDVTNFVKTGGESVNIAAGDGAFYQDLRSKAEVLEKIEDRVRIGFKTSAQEARYFKEAAVQIGIAFGDTSEEFLSFNKAVGASINEFNDLKAATKFQASDAKFITGLADAASTLAGAFGAAQAASALFAGDNEHLQEQLAKFQQLLVLINGLQAFANGLQAEAGGMQLLLSVRTQLVNAAKATQQLITAKSIQIMVAETAATSADAVATEALAGAKVEATVAEEAQTAASIENTEAITANAAANTAAAGATKSLSTTFIAGGIAALAIGAGVALALLTAKLIGYGETAGLTIKQQEQLADAMKDANAIIVEQSEFIKALDSATKNYYQNQLALSQAAGLNQYKQFALQQQIAAAEKESAQQQIDALGATNRQQAELASTIQLLNDRRLEAIRIEQALLAIPDKNRTGSQDDQLKAAQANVEFYQKQIDSVRGLYDAGQKARQDLFASIQKQGQLELQQQKFSADEQRKLTLETTKLEIDAQKDRNSKILGDARSTLGQRLAAIRSNRDLEKKEADAELASARSQYKAGLITPAELETAERQANAARTRADRDYLVQKRQEERAAYERDRDAALATYRTQVEQQIKLAQDLQQGIRNNPNPLQPQQQVPLSERLTGLSQEYEARRNLLNAELKVELDKEGQTAAEKKAIYEKYGADIADLGRDFRNKYLALEKEAQEASLAEWKKYYQQRQNEIDTNEIDQLKDLQDARDRDLINLREYNRQKQKIEDEARLAKTQAAVKDAYVDVNATKEGTAERVAAEAHLVEAVKTLNNQVTANHSHALDAQRDKVINTLNDIKAGYQSLANGVGAILDISTDSQKAKIEDLENTQQKSYESQIAAIQGTTASEEEKAARVTFLEKQRAAQKEANDRRARQLDNERAQFEKQAAIATIILDTTKAVLGFLDDPGGFAGIALSIGAGITGAAQLAKAVATQVPHYKLGAGVNGRPLHAGGLAIVGDGGEQELISEPGKKAYLSASTPQLLDLSPRTSVVPLSMLDEMSRMWVADGGRLWSEPADNSADLREIRNAIGWLGGVVRQSAKNNRPRVTVVNNIGKDVAHAAWVKKNIFD